MPFFHEDCKFADDSRGAAPRDVADAISRKGTFESSDQADFLPISLNSKLFFEELEEFVLRVLTRMDFFEFCHDDIFLLRGIKAPFDEKVLLLFGGHGIWAQFKV
jgi:hypothetical protein